MTDPHRHAARHVVGQASLEALPEVLAFAEAFCVPLVSDASIRFDVQLSIEEVYVNLVEHGYGSAPGPIEIRLSLRDDTLLIAVVDEAPPFPPDSAPAPDIGAGLEHRRRGGLGLHLVRQVMDDVQYSTGQDGKNQLLLTKYVTTSCARLGDK